ncbi:response regulator [Sphingobacterium sp.]|uniref:response regulator n=1 Tax=Sphingobacterium sp. TaxID=341027 RepID=UPI00289A4EC9|nr:response regulator [Sphingobacterium sp.]
MHADSDLLMRKIISNLFSNPSFRLDSAANGKEAFALLEAKDYQYDIVITEMHMQYANGYEIVNKIMQESPATKTIITSNMSYLHIREGLEIVREDCFKKPLVVGKLLERVEYMMRDEQESPLERVEHMMRDEEESPLERVEYMLGDEQESPLERVEHMMRDEEESPLERAEHMLEDEQELALEIPGKEKKVETMAETAIHDLAVAEFVAREEMTAIQEVTAMEQIPVNEILSEIKQNDTLGSCKRWW